MKGTGIGRDRLVLAGSPLARTRRSMEVLGLRLCTAEVYLASSENERREPPAYVNRANDMTLNENTSQP